MLRFVLLHHECPHGKPRPSHGDLMLEAEGGLLTWALAELPCDWRAAATAQDEGGRPRLAIASTNSVSAERLANHRLAYLDYEGPLGGDRGCVTRLDRGEVVPVSATADRWQGDLCGQVLAGRILLKRTGGSRLWQLSYRPGKGLTP